MAAMVDKIRELLANDEPYKAWMATREAYGETQGAERREVVELAVRALESIKSDLDEHGENNLHLYGNGEYSIEELEHYLVRARELLRELTAPPVPELPAVAASTASLGEPRDVGPSGPRPLVTAAGFVSTEGDKLVLRDLTGAVVRALAAPRAPKSIAVSPDGSAVAVAEHGGKVGLVDVATGTARWQVATQKGWVMALAFSPDGTRLVSGGEGRLVVHAVADGATVTSADASGKFRAATWTDDGIVTIAGQNLCVRTPELATVAQNKVKLDGNDHDLAVVAGRAIVAPYNQVAVFELTTAAPVASVKLVERVQRWSSARSLACARDVVAVLVEDQRLSYDDDGNETRADVVELQLFRVDSLARIATVGLPDFVASEELAIGGVAFAGDAILVTGSARTVAVPFQLRT